jgi:hypothetical protein
VPIDAPTSTPPGAQGGNLAIGTDAMSSIVSGTANMAIGEGSLKNYDSANNFLGFNTAIGVRSMEDTTDGVYNIAIGFEAMRKNIGGQSNIAIGNQCLGALTFPSAPAIGNDANIAIGHESLNKITTASGNIAIGTNAGASMLTGIQNCFFGPDAAISMTTGNNNICIGFQAQPATITTNNSITLGNSSHNVLRCQVTSITSLSDARDKKEIEELPVGLDFVKGLKPVKFVWDDRDENGNHDVKDFGFIAQDLKKSQEDANLADTLKLVYEENPEKLEASYGKLIPVLVKAIQELTAKVEALEAE